MSDVFELSREELCGCYFCALDTGYGEFCVETSGWDRGWAQAYLTTEQLRQLGEWIQARLQAAQEKTEQE